MNYQRDYTGAALLLAYLCAAMGIVAGLWTLAKWNEYGAMEHAIGLIMLASSLLAIWGSRRYVANGQNFKLAILYGGVCSVICGLMFGAMVLLMIAMSKKEFDELSPALRDE